MMLPKQTSLNHRLRNAAFNSDKVLAVSRPTRNVVLLVLLLVNLAACAGLSNPKPTDDDIKKAIMARGAWNPLVGRIELQSVEIEQIGKFNAEKKYWPVKVRVTTKYQTASLEFQIFRDDFGKWSARPADRS
jgi:hypothetical protein